MKLLKNKNVQAGSLYMFGNLFNKAISLLMIPILTRIMTTSEYGILNTYLSWVSIFTVFVGLSLGSSYRSALNDFRDDFSKYTSSIYGLSFISAVLTSVIVYIINIFFDFQMSNVMIMCCLIQSYMSFVVDSISNKYMMEMKFIKRTILLALPNFIIALLSVFFILHLDEKRYWGRIVPYVVIYIIFGTFILFAVFKDGKCIYNRKYWIYALRYSLPLIFHSLSCVVLASSDRIMISSMRSSSEAGIYSMIYNLSMAVKVITATLESIWIPWFTKKMIEHNKDAINKYVTYYIEIVGVLVCGIMMVAPEIVKIIAPESYWSGISMTVPIVLASFITFMYSISVDLEYYYKSTGFIAKNTILAAVINLGLNTIFIPVWGAIAAAYTTVVAYLVSFILHYIHARKLDQDLFPIFKYIPTVILVLTFCVLAYVFLDMVIIRWGISLLLVILYSVLIIKTDRKKLLQ